MAGKKISYLVVAILLLVALIAGYLFYRLARYEPVLTPNPENIGKREIASLPSDPIRKYGIEKGIRYEIEGSFEGEFVKRGQFLEGNFVIRDDPDKRRVKAFLGSQMGTAFLGTYKKTFQGESNWRLIPTDELSNFITSNRKVLIRVDLIVQDDSGANTGVAKDEIILDSLIDDFHEGIFDTKIPRDFILVAHAVGIVQQ